MSDRCFQISSLLGISISASPFPPVSYTHLDVYKRQPLYWWKEYDTYKVATVANSTSTMHKIHSKPFSIDDFSHDHMTPETLAFMETVVGRLEAIRLKYMEEGKNKEEWYDMIQLLPSSYNQMRTCTMNYETLINIYYARKAHKLEEWHSFCRWIESLPYAKELIVAAEE